MKPKRINWTAALSKPVEKIIYEQMNHLLEAAISWTMCACGNHCRKLPRYFDDSPKDEVLNNWGRQFNETVRDLGDAHWEQSWKDALHYQKAALTAYNNLKNPTK